MFLEKLNNVITNLDGADVMRPVHVLPAVLACALALPAFAQITRSVDEKGRVVYSDQPAACNIKGGKPVPNTPASGPAPAKKDVPLAVQPKYLVHGDPLIARMQENEQRRQRERVTATCWKQQGNADCTDEWTIRQMMVADAKAREAKEPKPKPAVREQLPPDFCQRNPRVEACRTEKPLPDVAPPPEKPVPEKPASKK